MIASAQDESPGPFYWIMALDDLVVVAAFGWSVAIHLDLDDGVR